MAENKPGMDSWRDTMVEPTVSQETIFEGKIVRLERHMVRLPNGKTSSREVIRHPGAVAVLAEPRPGFIVCVEQYRKAPDEVLLEIPAGKLEPGEEPLVCAARELEEETGYRANALSQVYEFFTSPGFADEKIYLFYTNQVQQGTVSLDDDEFLNFIELSRDDIVMRMKQGQIRDAKTLLALLWWLHDKEE